MSSPSFEIGDTPKIVSEVISIDDEEEEDIEVVFTNLNKSHVYRNLMRQKISEEIELLQAMCKETVPNEFSEFKEQVKKLGIQFEDDVIRSAWERIMKKYVTKLASFPSDKAPVCRVRPLLAPIDVTPIRLISPINYSVISPSSSTPLSSTAIPVALLLNKSVNIGNSQEKKEYSIKRLKLFGTVEIDTDDKNCHSNNSNNSPDKQLESAPEIGCSQSDVGSTCKNKVILNKNNSRVRKRTSDVLDSDLFKESFSNNVSEDLDKVQHSLVGTFSKSYFCDIENSGKNQPSQKNKVSQDNCQKQQLVSKQYVRVNLTKIVDKASNQLISTPQISCGQLDAEPASKNKISVDKRGFRKNKRQTNFLSSKLYKEKLSINVSEELDQNRNNCASSLYKKKELSQESSQVDLPVTDVAVDQIPVEPGSKCSKTDRKDKEKSLSCIHEHFLESASKNKVSVDIRDLRKNKRQTNVLSSKLYKENSSINLSEELDQDGNNCASSLSEDSLYKKKKLSKESSLVDLPVTDVSVDQIAVEPGSKCSKTESASKVNASGNNKLSKNKKSSFDLSVGKQCLSNSRSKESDKIVSTLVSPLSQSYIDSIISVQNHFSDRKVEIQKPSQKRKSSSDQAVSSLKTGNKTISKSHVGVKARIVRTKQKNFCPSFTGKTCRKTKKEMSEAELKEFKAEQKRIKYEEKRVFEMQQLQKVHDRLVDVLIPKYYNKELNKKS